MQTLNNAENGSCYKIADITDSELADKLSHYGIFKSSLLTKIDPDEVRYATLKVSTKRGTAAVPGTLAKGIRVRSGRGASKSLYEIEEGKSANIAEVDVTEKNNARLACLGIEKGVRVKLLRILPHMEYVVLIGGRQRMRISEAIASVIVGESLNMHKQFSFARKGRLFTVRSILAGKRINSYLKSIGIYEGAEISLEGIEPGKDIVFETNADICLYSMEGFRLNISSETARKILVT